ncbi:MAG: hypothetical protein LBS27_04450 [Bifidobacteriaceae bacterium]|jgi:plasmid stability protein|nr:hypothetical protein [Bifidobacteriaceae bacterium]
MALLQVRNCPDELYRTVADRAAADRRSIAQETVVLLEEALEARTQARRERRGAALGRLAGDPERQRRMALEPALLIREDRDR